LIIHFAILKLDLFIKSNQVIRFLNAKHSYTRSNSIDLSVGPPSTFVCSVLRGSSLDLSSLLSWLKHRFRPSLSSSIVVNSNLFKDLSSIIASNDRGSISVSSRLANWTIEIKAADDSSCSVSWILIYRASISGYRAADFHQACDGMGKCVVVLKSENGRIVAAYNEDGFISAYGRSPNINGFIVSVDEDRGADEIFHRNDSDMGIENHSSYGPVFGNFGDLVISTNCHQGEISWSVLGASYGELEVNRDALVGQEWL
jgi:hypothetical protein